MKTHHQEQNIRHCLSHYRSTCTVPDEWNCTDETMRSVNESDVWYLNDIYFFSQLKYQNMDYRMGSGFS